MPTSELHDAKQIESTDAARTCDVCPHPWHEHDPIGARYCAATTASALPRGCVCS